MMDGTAAVQAGSVPGFWVLMVKTIGGLCLVLGVLVGVLFILKYLTRPGVRPGKKDKNAIRLVSTFYLAPKERLHLMDVMGRKILIGVTAQGINRIAEFDETYADAEEDTPEEAQPGVRSMFRDILARIGRESVPAEIPAVRLSDTRAAENIRYGLHEVQHDS
jgi:flagellar protein FliO/FliZ